MDNHIKGDLYEKFIRSYINNLDYVSDSYLWKDVSESILHDAGFITDFNRHRLDKKNNNKVNPLQDVGVDIFQINYDKSITLVQCKNYSNTIKDLLGFSNVMVNHIEKKKSCIILINFLKY